MTNSSIKGMFVMFILILLLSHLVSLDKGGTVNPLNNNNVCSKLSLMLK